MAQKKAVVSKEKSMAQKSTPSSVKPVLKAVDSASQKSGEDLPKAKHIGEVLKRVRESKKETIKEIGAILRISERYLEAIESLNIERFPEQVYTLGFVRSYAHYLGADPQESVAQFKTEVYATTASAKKLPVPKPVSSAPLPTKQILWGVTLVLIIFLGVAYIQWGTSSDASLEQEISDLLMPLEDVTPVDETVIMAPNFDQDPVAVEADPEAQSAPETIAKKS